MVITGIGGVTSLGNTIEETWEGLVAGKSGAGPITQFDPDGYPVNFACEVRDLDIGQYIDHKSARRMDRFTHLALVQVGRERQREFFEWSEKELLPALRDL